MASGQELVVKPEVVQGEVVRGVDHDLADFFAFFLTGEIGYLKKEVTEEEVARFCGPCDFAANNCVGERNDQGRYVARGGCGWAQVKGVRGSMSEKGFKPYGLSEIDKASTDKVKLLKK